ncbi:MAG: hypothetical protein R3C26_12405 [Calditrichia bacterium]
MNFSYLLSQSAIDFLAIVDTCCIGRKFGHSAISGQFNALHNCRNWQPLPTPSIMIFSSEVLNMLPYGTRCWDVPSPFAAEYAPPVSICCLICQRRDTGF